MSGNQKPPLANITEMQKGRGKCVWLLLSVLSKIESAFFWYSYQPNIAFSRG